MTLSGSTRDFPLDAVLRLLEETKKTGELQLHAGDRIGALGLAEGRVVAAVYGEEAPLAALGEIFTLEGADFEFTPWDEAPPANLEEGDLAGLLKKADDRRRWLAGVREVIPNDSLRFRLSERAAEQGAVTFTADRWRVVLAVNGERDVNTLAETLHMDRDAALTALSGLVRDGVIVAVMPPAGPAIAAPPPPPAPEPEPAPPTAVAPPIVEPAPVVEPAPPPMPEPGAPMPEPVQQWAPPRAAPEPMPTFEPEPAPAAIEPAAVDDRLAALSGIFGPAPAAAPASPVPPAMTPPTPVAPPPAAPAGEWAAPAPVADQWSAPTPAADQWAAPAPAADQWAAPAPAADDPRLAAFGQPPAPEAWSATAPAADQWSTPALAADAWTAPTPTADQAAANQWATPAADDPRLAAFAAPGAPAMPMPQAPAMPAAEEWGIPAAPAPEKKRGLFGFGTKAKAQAAAPTTVAIGPVSRPAMLAALSNALISEYNSGQYGKGRVDERMTSLLMRVDEQADPIDRPLPIVDDRIDVQALDRDRTPADQLAPYLALLVSTIFRDAEKAFGKDKAKKGYRAAMLTALGSDSVALATPELAGKLPKV